MGSGVWLNTYDAYARRIVDIFKVIIMSTIATWEIFIMAREKWQDTEWCVSGLKFQPYQKK
jgi:hypothetical protein